MPDRTLLFHYVHRIVQWRSRNFFFFFLFFSFFFFFFIELVCWGKAMLAYTKPQQRKKEESERLRGERYQIKFIDLGFERCQIVRFRKARGRQDVP